MPDATVAVLCGGVGAARFLVGLVAATDPARVTAIINTGDDCVLHGLSISPDLDTITYTLAGAIDPERGWGLAGETWNAMAALGRYADIRPSGSAAAPTWFNLGDRDLATHFYRTARLAERATPSEIADEIRRAWGIPIRMLPMSDEPFATIVSTPEFGDMSFQDYFVRLQHSVPISGVYFEGAASLATGADLAIGEADAVVIAPSNPLVSIGPIRSLPGVDAMLADRRDSVIAISPIIGGQALKGPADRMLAELGHDASVVGVARMYAGIAATLVVDTVDAELADAVRAEGMACVVTSTIMTTPEIAKSLAISTLDAVGCV